MNAFTGMSLRKDVIKVAKRLDELDELADADSIMRICHEIAPSNLGHS